MMCGACPSPAVVEVSPVLHLCSRCESILKSKFTSLDFLSAQTPRGESGGLTAALGVPPMVEAAAEFPSSVSSRVTDVVPAPAFDRLPASVPVTNDDGIPAFLRRNPDNSLQVQS